MPTAVSTRQSSWVRYLIALVSSFMAPDFWGSGGLGAGETAQKQCGRRAVLHHFLVLAGSSTE